MPLFQEIPQSPALAQSAKQHYDGTKRFVVTNENARNMMTTLWDSPLNGFSGPFCPRCRHISYTENTPDPGMTIITAQFKTIRTPGVALLRGGKAVLARSTPYTDQDGDVMNGVDADGFRWKSTRRTQFHFQASLVVETAYTSKVPIGDLMDRIGYANTSPMSNMGVAKEVAMLMDFPFTRYWHEDDLWYVDLHFLCEPGGWNDSNPAQKYNRVMLISDSMNYTTGKVQTGNGRKYLAWLPTGETAARRSVQTASFADIDRMIVEP